MQHPELSRNIFNLVMNGWMLFELLFEYPEVAEKKLFYAVKIQFLRSSFVVFLGSWLVKSFHPVLLFNFLARINSFSVSC